MSSSLLGRDLNFDSNLYVTKLTVNYWLYSCLSVSLTVFHYLCLCCLAGTLQLSLVCTGLGLDWAWVTVSLYMSLSVSVPVSLPVSPKQIQP